MFLELRAAVNAYHNRLSAPGSGVTPSVSIKHVTGGGDARTEGGAGGSGEMGHKLFLTCRNIDIGNYSWTVIAGQSRNVFNITNISLLRQQSPW